MEAVYYKLMQNKHDPSPNGWERCDLAAAISGLAAYLCILVKPPRLGPPEFLNLNEDADGVQVLRVSHCTFDITDPAANVLTNVGNCPEDALRVAAGFLMPTLLWLDREIARATEDEQRHDLSCFFEGQADAQGRLEALNLAKAHIIYWQMRDGERGQDEDYKERRALDPN